jgi:hypothetical protein
MSVLCVCATAGLVVRTWYFRNEALCSVTNIMTGFAGCPYMFSSSATCLQSTTQRPGCAGYFQGSYQSQFRTYAMVAVPPWVPRWSRYAARAHSVFPAVTMRCDCVPCSAC